MIWDWGFTLQNIRTTSCTIAIDCSFFGGNTGQGVGSVSVIDSIFTGGSYVIRTHADGPTPNLLLDNVHVSDVPSIVGIAGGVNLLAGEFLATSATHDIPYEGHVLVF